VIAARCILGNRNTWQYLAFWGSRAISGHFDTKAPVSRCSPAPLISTNLFATLTLCYGRLLCKLPCLCFGLPPSS
jgi:hypothetical protein